VGEKKIFGPNFRGKVVSAPPGRECTPSSPEAKQKSKFLKVIGRYVWAMGEVI